ncbi:DUF3693 domain-containing protein [Stenotrophomonas maltophilia]|uniref:DUF3693 domain-containing protein n=1 Tax=Stenotrophomonas maltophilia TaxID=40324 RepID=UPI002E78DD4D|nr:DUF3693 domain-containing protein [Stenotrophomonas maltophilia]
MQTLNKVLDMARAMCSRDSDRALAQALKVTPTTILGWRNGSRRITDEHLMAVIEKAQADPALAVLVRQETAETRAEKKGWATLWDRLSAAAAVLVLVVIAMPGVARAKPFEIKAMEAGNAAVCILCYKGVYPGEPQAVQSWPHAAPLLSAANLGQLVRQLVAIDALSYVQSQ